MSVSAVLFLSSIAVLLARDSEYLVLPREPGKPPLRRPELVPAMVGAIFLYAALAVVSALQWYRRSLASAGAEEAKISD